MYIIFVLTTINNFEIFHRTFKSFEFQDNEFMFDFQSNFDS
jgi:hypothetical protein